GHAPALGRDGGSVGLPSRGGNARRGGHRHHDDGKDGRRRGRSAAPCPTHLAPPVTRRRFRTSAYSTEVSRSGTGEGRQRTPQTEIRAPARMRTIASSIGSASPDPYPAVRTENATVVPAAVPTYPESA